MGRGDGLRHIRLYVRDLSRMRQFYETVLGFRPRAVADQAAHFDVGGVDLVLTPDPPFADPEHRDFINQLKGNMRGMGTSFHFDVDDVDASFRGLEAKGLVPIDPEKNRRLDAPLVRADGRREFAIEDPEGYWLWFGQEGSR